MTLSEASRWTAAGAEKPAPAVFGPGEWMMDALGKTSEAEVPSTCGAGLAAHAAVPEQMAVFLAALAENLEAHVPTIDTGDASGRAEREAYVHLSSEYAAVAKRLAATAARMAAARDLPAARHHEEALADPGLLDAFERFVELEAQLADALRASAERDGRFLRQARGEEGTAK